MTLHKQRLYGLDILRIIAAVMVCAFHTNGHLNANYGWLTAFVSQGAIFMTLFFMLSGYSLYIGYSGKSFVEKNNLILFLKKRFISVVPMYWVTGFIFVIGETLKSGGG